ncbi:hypothetical protein GGTG_04159, partial [Gaeumannomyces tritici R3-111a-1]
QPRPAQIIGVLYTRLRLNVDSTNPTPTPTPEHTTPRGGWQSEVCGIYDASQETVCPGGGLLETDKAPTTSARITTQVLVIFRPFLLVLVTAMVPQARQISSPVADCPTPSNRLGGDLDRQCSTEV